MVVSISPKYSTEVKGPHGDWREESEGTIVIADGNTVIMWRVRIVCVRRVRRAIAQ